MNTVLPEPKSATESEELTAVPETKLRQRIDRSAKISEIFAETGADVPAGSYQLVAQGIACDSRKVEPGYLFFALHGAKDDGNKYVRDAIERGAVAIASESEAPANVAGDVPWIRVPESRNNRNRPEGVFC